MKRSELDRKTVAELRKLAASLRLSGISGLRKSELVDLVAKASRKKRATRPGEAAKRVGPAKASRSGKTAGRTSAKVTRSGKTAGRTPAKASRKKRATRPGEAAKPSKPEAVASALSPRLRRAFSSRPRNGEQRVKASKYFLGVPEPADLDDGFSYPETHGENIISLMVRDPYWLFAYWEFAPELRGELVARIGEKALLRSRTVLRVYDVTGTEPESAAGHYDIDVAPEARNWYINVARVEREYCVDVGLIAPDGTFIVIARSNRVSLPPVGPSDAVDEEWVTIDALDELYVQIEAHRGPSSGSGGWGSGGFGR